MPHEMAFWSTVSVANYCQETREISLVTLCFLPLNAVSPLPAVNNVQVMATSQVNKFIVKSPFWDF